MNKAAPPVAIARREHEEALPRPVPIWRAILIGLLLIPVSTYYGNYAYVVVQAMLWGRHRCCVGRSSCCSC